MAVRNRLPTSRADWRLMGRTARLVLTIPGYAVLGALAWIGGLALFVFAQNVDLVVFALGSGLTTEARVSILVGLFPFVGTAYDLVSGSVLVLVAGLVAVDVTMAVYHFREHRVSIEQGGGSAIGVLLGTLGAGCAACGTAILAGLLSLFGAAGLLTLLPLDGLEFSLLAGVALVLSIYWLADGMRGGEINGCPIDL
ncbi:hypothetical protein VB773_07640 [Haloarculaceae archaeon H-GB2-1]|nr:hypothetical protein [Haloarculaceae archaeon H-GB1-1]MEA5385943.1 hypothetical protein [Haloarculaceae archaeon H-GB11]MEA5407451.1 hypothetical protein [Haloarculaceae archaeon H-GB2-1]